MAFCVAWWLLAGLGVWDALLKEWVGEAESPGGFFMSTQSSKILSLRSIPNQRGLWFVWSNSKGFLLALVNNKTVCVYQHAKYETDMTSTTSLQPYNATLSPVCQPAMLSTLVWSITYWRTKHLFIVWLICFHYSPMGHLPNHNEMVNCQDFYCL